MRILISNLQFFDFQAQIHPFHILVALETYKTGNRGKLKWILDPEILVALNQAFYKAFKVMINCHFLMLKQSFFVKQDSCELLCFFLTEYRTNREALCIGFGCEFFYVQPHSGMQSSLCIQRCSGYVNGKIDSQTYACFSDLQICVTVMKLLHYKHLH